MVGFLLEFVRVRNGMLYICVCNKPLPSLPLRHYAKILGFIFDVRRKHCTGFIIACMDIYQWGLYPII